MISITRALTELKLLNKKIEQKQAGLQIAAAVKDHTPEKEAMFLSDAKSKMDQITGLIDRRAALKKAIVMSNAVTKVTIGTESMTVAEAIERKTSIELEKSYCKAIRENYYGYKTTCERHNETVENEANRASAEALGADTEGDKGAAYTAIVEAYKKKNQATLIAPEGIEQTIEDLQDKIDEFESEVDFILSESNTKTMIEV
jgi:hypothetical protein